MKIEKILGIALSALVVICAVVYLTLPKRGEQVYIPPAEHTVPDGVEIPEGYKLVDNYTDVYYSEQEDGIHYYWLVKFSDGSYGWQEVDKDGNIIFPNHGSEAEQSESTSDETTNNESAESTPENTESSTVTETGE